MMLRRSILARVVSGAYPTPARDIAIAALNVLPDVKRMILRRGDFAFAADALQRDPLRRITL
jgi:hypothetical protein